MSHRAGSLLYQVNQIFASGHAIGGSKHAAKRDGTLAGRVFAVRSDWDYRDGTLYFARWARERHGCSNVADAVRRLDWGLEWSEELAIRGLAASTRKTYLSGVAKACGIIAPTLRPAWTVVIAAVGRRTPPPPRGYGENAERLIANVCDTRQKLDSSWSSPWRLAPASASWSARAAAEITVSRVTIFLGTDACC